jgi:hypothetical protein
MRAIREELSNVLRDTSHPHFSTSRQSCSLQACLSGSKKSGPNEHRNTGALLSSTLGYPGGAKNSSAMLSGSRNDRPEP